MKQQNESANRDWNRFSSIFTRSDVLEFALSRPKTVFWGVVSTHPLTLWKPD